MSVLLSTEEIPGIDAPEEAPQGPVRVDPVDVRPVIAKIRFSDGDSPAGAPARVYLEWGGKLFVYDHPKVCG